MLTASSRLTSHRCRAGHQSPGVVVQLGTQPARHLITAVSSGTLLRRTCAPAPAFAPPNLRLRTSPRLRAAEEDPVPEPDAVSASLAATAGTQKTLSFLAFWVQLALTLVSAGVLLFSVFISSNSTAGSFAVDVTKFFTLAGVALALISTFFAHGFLTLAKKLAAGEAVDIEWVLNSLSTNTIINIVGIGITTIGLQASVGTLVGKTLLSATSTLQYNPSSTLVSLDVFALQASTNILLSHLIGLTFANVMLRLVRKARAAAAATA